MEIKLDSPKTLILQPGTIAYILDLLADQPFKKAQGPIGEIVSQIQTQNLSLGDLVKAAKPNGEHSEYEPIG